MLNLDGAAFDMSGRKFSYELPKPWGPDRGPAHLIVIARPAAGVNTDFKQAFDGLLHSGTVNDMTAEKEFEKTNDIDALVKARTANNRSMMRAIAELRHDHCIVEWETNIQSGGKALEATKENFMALAEFQHKEIAAVFAQMNKDLSEFDNFSIDAASDVLEEEAKN